MQAKAIIGGSMAFLYGMLLVVFVLAAMMYTGIAPEGTPAADIINFLH